MGKPLAFSELTADLSSTVSLLSLAASSVLAFGPVLCTTLVVVHVEEAVVVGAAEEKVAVAVAVVVAVAVHVMVPVLVAVEV
eukprot:CAMPEP_0197626752 /NCGR_PEP_ID=MMETSP1338-20131121/5574_1 /TAXON_ID=43686 ORGANISM="Pelagodinium beii, Strain RCC1491" /NCGR_SAMPLE_ID=MMETSP1338 /ASSEMBLY_ACC=CAM_ASM_000754 /LENGTH=81 /DNA_ID=CAMNT_0043197309 /DNA_START=299 /DNA_END=544 /DNA_ORIENTATION=-